MDKLENIYYLTYSKKDSIGGGYILRVRNKTFTEYVIPDFFNNLPITRLGECAFSQCKIQSIIVPDTVTKLDDDCFLVVIIWNQ
jgi:hypothetical protein